jgi:hypothetical protein
MCGAGFVGMHSFADRVVFTIGRAGLCVRRAPGVYGWEPTCSAAVRRLVNTAPAVQTLDSSCMPPQPDHGKGDLVCEKRCCTDRLDPIKHGSVQRVSMRVATTQGPLINVCTGLIFVIGRSLASFALVWFDPALEVRARRSRRGLSISP